MHVHALQELIYPSGLNPVQQCLTDGDLVISDATAPRLLSSQSINNQGSSAWSGSLYWTCIIRQGLADLVSKPQQPSPDEVQLLHALWGHKRCSFSSPDDSPAEVAH